MLWDALGFQLSINWSEPKYFTLPDYVEYGCPTWPSWNQWMVPGGDYDETEVMI